MTSTNELSSKYQKKTDKEHILDNPDTYIGSVERIDTHDFILEHNGVTPFIVKKDFTFIPGLYKLFDEAIVNCRDHAVRMEELQKVNDPTKSTIPVTNIEITIADDGTIMFLNDGNGIDIAQHPEYQIWIPEMIFAHLRTGTNYNKAEKKIVGGKNGFGAKLIFIWSTYGTLETVDYNRGLKFTQEYGRNLDTKREPVIKKCKSKPYTKITFKPDYARLGIENLSEDMVSLFKKRAYDIAAITNKNIKVKLNGELLPVKNFQQYVDMYIGNKQDTVRVHEEDNGRWEYVVALSSNDEFQQVSFVNGIYTSKGGKHVEYVLNQITKRMVAYIYKKKKIEVKANNIKEQLMLFVRCDIENPSFDSQTKDYMNTPSAKFGSSCTVSEKFIEKVAKMGVMDAACNIYAVKENNTAKKSDGQKSKNIRGIPKLVDANLAGTAKSSECTIIFCEGDSAKAGIISGLSKEDRDYIGVYPMKGKLFNVRGETIKRISENKEIVEIKQILGLETEREYTTLDEVHRELRYGKIIFMTDQDLDGSHIKGLGINLFQCQWASLIKLNVIGFMNTPILKAKRGNVENVFYNDGEYEAWKQEHGKETGWKIKYYKGLGTSTGEEFKEYFRRKKLVYFKHTQDTENIIDMVFNKKRSDDRKDWLCSYERNMFLDTNQDLITYPDFINREFRHFSKYDCDRSIPNLMDGLKTSQRKILYSAFKKKLTSEIKVAQFSGYVSEQSGYHHGEASLNGAIVGMAQNYVGSNNINLMMPNGQFGTRLNGGKDSASERYIFTQLNPITRYIYPETDDPILNYLDDDGQCVEPTFYAPIIPMILINGAKGIGTGFSTDVMSYNPMQIVQYMKSILTDTKDHTEFLPYYEGFKGTISQISDGRYLIKGCYAKNGTDHIRITELPIGTWTDDYKKFIESLIDHSKKTTSVVKDYNDMSTDKTVDIALILHKGALEKLEAMEGEYGTNGIEKYFRLYTTNTNTNMHLFNEKEQLCKYNSVHEIIENYYIVRLAMYETRKAMLMKHLEKEVKLLSNRATYITETLDGTVDLRGRKKNEISEMLSKRGFDVLDEDLEYKYLVKMPMDSVSDENVTRLAKEHNKKITELDTLAKTSIKEMWLGELNHLETEMQNYIISRNNTITIKPKGNKSKMTK